MKPNSGSVLDDTTKFYDVGENGSANNMSFFGGQSLPFPAASEPSRLVDPRLAGSKRSMSSVAALKEYVKL